MATFAPSLAWRSSIQHSTQVVCNAMRPVAHETRTQRRSKNHKPWSMHSFISRRDCRQAASIYVRTYLLVPFDACGAAHCAHGQQRAINDVASLSSACLSSRSVPETLLQYDVQVCPAMHLSSMGELFADVDVNSAKRLLFFLCGRPVI